jgi:ribosome biogenesis GTPase
LEQRRLKNYQKLLREQRNNGATLAEQRARNRQFGKLVRNTMSEKRKRYQDY